jgi:osmoprotectant transport system substrate-binding protein
MGGKKSYACLMIALALVGCSSLGRRLPIRVGSKNFTEQVLLGEIIAQHLEHQLQVPVDRRLNLGGTLLANQALRSGEIDLYPEYTGTALASILRESSTGTPAQDLELIRSRYSRDWKIAWLDPIGIDNGFAMVVKGSDARARNLESLSDAAKAGTGWALGVGYEFEQRPDGLPALNRTYGIRWNGRPMSMDLGLLYRALEQGQVTMIAASATDGLLSKLDLKILRDDKHAFPSYEVAIAVREDSLGRTPGLRKSLLELTGKIDNSTMQKLNYQVDAEHRPVATVAQEFLRSCGLL